MSIVHFRSVATCAIKIAAKRKVPREAHIWRLSVSLSRDRHCNSAALFIVSSDPRTSKVKERGELRAVLSPHHRSARCIHRSRLKEGLLSRLRCPHLVLNPAIRTRLSVIQCQILLIHLSSLISQRVVIRVEFPCIPRRDFKAGKTFCKDGGGRCF